MNTKGGCDIVDAVAQEAFDAGGVVHAQDVKIAFQSMRRQRIHNGILEGCPSISNFFLWTYRDASPLMDSKGNKFGECQTGVPQGDPASMLLFSLGYHPVLLELQTLIKKHEVEYREAHPTEPISIVGKLVSFADDTTWVTAPEIAFQLVEPTVGLYRKHGLDVHKFYLIGKDVDVLPDPPDGVTLSTEGGLICKSGIGTTEFCTQELTRKVDSVCIPVRALVQLPTRHGTAQLKMSINLKLVRVPQYGQ